MGERHKQSFQFALTEELLVVAGTDAGLPDMPFDSLHEESALMVKFGMTPRRAVRAATFDAACALGLVKTLGLLRPGFTADLVLVDKNPLSDLATLRTSHAVIKDGKVVFGTLRTEKIEVSDSSR